MAKPTKKWVAFKSNCKVPAGILDKHVEVKVETGIPVQLPIAYAKHVIDDGFADACDAPKKPTKKQLADDLEKDIVVAASAVEVAQLAFDEADTDETIEAATNALTDAQNALAELESSQG